MLELKDIKKVYKTGAEEVHALKGIDLKFRESEFVAILGQSGCGKTTMLNIIGGLDQYSSGDLIINGRSTKEYKDRDWDSYRNHSVGFVFQSYNLIPHQSVLQNVELALSLSGVNKTERRNRAIEALKSVGLGDQLNKKPSEMSGGQMQRVAIARAIVNNPDIILADEPTGALDSETSVQVMDILREIAKDRLVVMVTHNPELAEQYATRIVRMLDGKIIDDSMPMSPDEVREALAKTDVSQAKEKKPSLSFKTSFILSLKNLFTKKGRTLLTAFAGSIGIIGIALIYAVSNGTSGYIDSIQQDALSSYPLTIVSDTTDMSSLMKSIIGSVEDALDQEDGTFVEQQMMSHVFAQMGKNDLGSFKKYIENHYDEIDEYVTNIQYGYSITPQIYTTDVTGDIIQVNPSSLFSSVMPGGMASQFMNTGVFTEMVSNKEMLSEQYELLAGEWADEYDEMVFVLPTKSGLTDFVAYSLGMLDPGEVEEMLESYIEEENYVQDRAPVEWTYDDLLNLSFSLVNSYDYYKYNSEYDIWEDMRDDDEYIDKIVKTKGEKLKVVGVITPKSSSTMVGMGVAYTPLLKEHIINNAKDSKIVKAQMADEETDIFSGKKFSELEEDEGSGLEFEDMISIDTKLLSEAFGVKITEDDINNIMAPHMEKITLSITADTTPAYTALKEITEDLTKGMINAYIDKNTDENGMVTISSENAAAFAAEYLVSDEAKAIYGFIETEFNFPSDALVGIFNGMLGPVMGGMGQYEGMSVPAVLVKPYVDKIIDEFMANEQLDAALLPIARSITETNMQVKIMTSVGELVGGVMGSLSNAFNVDAEKIASAFKFNMTEEDLSRLMSTLGSTQVNSYDTNLRRLGYSDLDKPVVISIYFHDFETKDHFIEFIEKYNSDMESSGREEYSISYTDTTAILMSSVKTIVNSVSYVLIAFVSISLVVSSIMIGVITLISVQERTKEIGILRAIGASKKNVSNMFNAETMIIGFSSGLIGVVVTYLLCIPINAVLLHLTGLTTLKASLPISVGIILVIISTLLTMFSGIIPSRSAAKKDPVVALRTE